MDAKKIIQTGNAGTGKSTITEQIRKQYLNNGFGVLIYDIKNEKAYESVPNMPLSALKKWNGKGEYKVSMLSDDNFSIVDVFKIILERKGKLRNFFFVLEDAHGYINPQTAKPIIAVFGASRQWGITFLANYWAIKQVPPFFCEMCNYLIIRKTNDSFKRPQDLEKFTKPDEIFRAWQTVQNHKDNYHSVTLKIT
ncbi:hypothetical protein VB776_16270 [Arcicella sp. DC2W]|uniref:Uncharacterized protein n=1 Tax=Arcicella gelida TaxID=2984195 RepID=A0ABU5S7N6_9BACT|nr:hypothetical protein [Arcicella sp. DC2W]MEA5404489.1 hypothetical protein [Arcicella sp. DC2W]